MDFRVTCFFFVALWCVYVEQSEAIWMDIRSSSPTNSTNQPSDEVRISCLPDLLDKRAREIVFMRITRSGDVTPLAYIHHNFKVSYSTGSPQDFQVIGHIDKDFKASYLNVTLIHPNEGHAGIYTCDVYYVDDRKLLQQETASGNLVVKATKECSILKKVVDKLLKRVSILEDTIDTLATKDSVSDVLDRVEENNNDTKTAIQETVTTIGMELEELQTKVGNHSKHIDHLTQTNGTLTQIEDRVTVLEVTSLNHTSQLQYLHHKVGRMEAFSATLTKDHRPSVGGVIVFSDVIMSRGQGYDPRTGVFTAHVDGLYTFHVVAMMKCFDCFIDVDLMCNDKVLSSLSAEAVKDYDQASVSTITELKAGDKVKVVVVSMSFDALLNPDKLSLFSGYLIAVSG